MSTFKKDILLAVGEDKIEAVAIREIECYFWNEKDPRFVPANEAAKENKLFTFAEALELLDYEYEDSYGSMDCHDITMWSADWVYYIHEYDGATYVNRVPRNPKVIAS